MYILLTKVCVISELCECQIVVICSELALKHKHLKYFKSAKYAAGSDIVEGGWIQLIAQKLLDPDPCSFNVVALAELDID